MENNLKLIDESGLLDESIMNILDGLKVELKDTMEKTQIFRTRTEMEVSVLNAIKHPTPASKYWQSMREQSVHFHELMMLSYEFRKLQIETLKLKRSLTEEQDDLEADLLKVEIEKNEFVLLNQRRVAKARLSEILHWSEIKSREAAQMTAGELHDVDNHQLLSYTKRWIQQSIVMDGGGSPSERQNLLGQLRSGILACIQKGVIEDVLHDLEPRHRMQIYQEYRTEIEDSK